MSSRASATMASPPQNPYEFTREEYNALIKTTPSAHISQRSEYEEIELIEDCTLYDIYRQPRAPITDPHATKTLPVRVLNAELTCPICLGVIRNTMVVMECLHRFCGECIQKCLRLGNKECPSCRIHIPSKRSLRRDENFDALIKKIYPDLAEFEREEAKLIEEINRSRHFNNAFTESAKVGAQNQEKIRRQGGKKKLPGGSPPPSATTAPSSSSSSNSNGSGVNGREREKRLAPDSSSSSSPSDSTSHSDEDDEPSTKRVRSSAASTFAAAGTTSSNTLGSSSLRSTVAVTSATGSPAIVNIRLVLHPEERSSAPKLQTSVFATPIPLKIVSLKRQIARFLKLSAVESMHVVLSEKNCAKSGLSRAALTPGGGVVIRKDLLFDQELEDYMTIEDIYQQYRMGTDWELLLYYHFSDTIVNGVAQFITAGSSSGN